MQEKLVKKQEILFLEQNSEPKIQEYNLNVKLMLKKFRKEESYKPLILYDFEILKCLILVFQKQTTTASKQLKETKTNKKRAKSVTKALS